MGRRNERGLELTFHGPSKRWRKRINGRDHFFGHGNGVSDRASYRAALAKYRDFMDQRARAQAVEALPTLVAAGQFGPFDPSPDNFIELLTMLRLAYPNSYISALDPPPPNCPPHKPEHIYPVPADVAEAVIKGVAERVKAAKEAAQRKWDGRGVSEADKLLDAYQAELRRRYEQTAKAPASLQPKARLGGSAYRCQTFSLKLFRQHLHDERLASFNDAPAVERALASFRAGFDARVADGTMKPGTIEANLKALRPFFTWAWRNREISELPRNLTTVCTKAPRQSTANPLEVAVIQGLWARANDRMRCFIALGLNAGSYAIDIATLQPEHLTAAPGYIARHRHKTSVPLKIKLWPLTATLIARHRTDQGGLVFTRRFKGQELPWVVERDNGKYNGIAAEFAKLAKAAGVTASWSQLRDTSAHHIEQMGINGDGATDKELVSQFLGHADNRMARLYLSQTPAKLERAKLDAALMKLADIYSVEDDPNLAARSRASAA